MCWKPRKLQNLTIMAKKKPIPSVCLHQSGIHMKKELPSFFSKNFQELSISEVPGFFFKSQKESGPAITCYPKLHLWATREPPSVNLILSLVTFFSTFENYSITRINTWHNLQAVSQLWAPIIPKRCWLRTSWCCVASRRPQPLVCTSNEHEDKSTFE